MAGDVGDVVRAVDAPVGIDQVAVATRERGVLVRRIARHAIRDRGAAVGVAQETERELLGGCERQVLLGCVERGAEDGDTEFLEPLGAVTQRLAFDRSTGGGSFRIPPEQDPAAGKARQRHDVAVLVDHLEVGCRLSFSQHASILPLERVVPPLSVRAAAEKDDGSARLREWRRVCSRR